MNNRELVRALRTNIKNAVNVEISDYKLNKLIKDKEIAIEFTAPEGYEKATGFDIVINDTQETYTVNKKECR